MINNYEKILELIYDNAEFYFLEINRLQHGKIKVDENISFKIIETFKMIEKILNFMMFEKNLIDISDNFYMQKMTTEGEKIFKQQDIYGVSNYLSTISCFLRCNNYINIPKEIRTYINNIRYFRNVIAHGIDEYKNLNLIFNYYESLYIFLYWFIDEYLGKKVDDNLRNNALEKIKKSKINLIHLKVILNVASEEEVSPNSFDINNNLNYIKFLENRIVELELKLSETSKAAQLNLEALNILKSLGEQVPLIMDSQNLIIKKIDDLTNFIIDGKFEIQRSLEEAYKNKNVEEVENIINMFSNRVTSELVNNIQQQNHIDNIYESEKRNLIISFNEKNWDKLDNNSKNFLISGKVLYRKIEESSTMDFSGVCLLITKAVDYELHKYLYTNFKTYLKNLYENNEIKWPSFFKKNTCYGESVICDNDFTLGSVKYFCCKGKNHSLDDKFILLDYCKNYLFKESKEVNIERNLKFISDSAEKIRLDYRNPAAHINGINKIKADDCMNYIIDTTKILITLMEIFK